MGYPAQCAGCGITFSAPPRQSTGKFCTHACYTQSRNRQKPLTCRHCGKNYTVVSTKQDKSRFCSAKCKQVSQRKRVEKNCEQCGKTFVDTIVHGESRRHCSRKCLGLSQRSRVQTSCPVCGKVSTDRTCRKRKVCSAACRDVAHQKPKVKRVCAHCGKVDFVYPYLKDSRHCSTRCWKLNRGETQIEKAARLALEAMNIKYIQEHRVNRFRIDFYLPDFDIALEMDGDYWHDAARDAKRDKALLEKGIRTIRIKQTEIKHQSVASLILERVGLGL